METWKLVKGYEDYEVSDLGRVRSLKYGKVKIMIPRLSTSGYQHLGLRSNRKQKTYTVHRLVAQAFILNPENKKTVNHIDGVKTNNCVSNLEWATPAENIQHAIGTGLMHTKLTNDEVTRISLLLKENKLNQANIARMFNIDASVISRINSGKSWKHI